MRHTALMTRSGVLAAPQAVLEGPALDFILATGITDPVISNAVLNLVTTLQAEGLWDKCVAIYPFVGGTEDTCKYNLKDPQDIDGAYRLSFTGTNSFASTGYTPSDATPSYGDTHFLIDNFTRTSLHTSVFVQTFQGSNTRSQIGYFPGSDAYRVGLGLAPSQLTAVSAFFSEIDFVGSLDYPAGFFIGSRIGDTSLNLYADGVSILGNTGAAFTGVVPSANILIGTGETTTVGCGDEISFASFGNGLTSAEAEAFNTIVQAFQTELGR